MRSERHPFDRYYNFFSRSAWTVGELSRSVARAVVEELCPDGVLGLVVDDTLLHKRGKHVHALGWFYDAVASTEARPVTAPGNNWVVVGLSIPLPDGSGRTLCLPLQARLHRPGNEPPSCPQLAADMVWEIAGWFPGRTFELAGDGGYSAHQLLEHLPETVAYVGCMRVDAELYSPDVPPRPPGKRGPPAKKGPRLPNPRTLARLADANTDGSGPWKWTETVEITMKGERQQRQALSTVVLWPKVYGLKPVRLLVLRDPKGDEPLCLFSIRVDRTPQAMVDRYTQRSPIEQAFRASKQYLQIEAPHHWCRQSIEKLAPWVWLLQTLVILWYLTAGRHSPAAAVRRRRMGPWDSEWSLRHMLQTLRDAHLEATITTTSRRTEDMQHFIRFLKYCVQLAL